MGDPGAMVPPLGDWLQVPRAIEDAIRGVTEDDLDRAGGSNGWSIRETVHHLVESNLVACSSVIAAVSKIDGTYDWSWLTPDRSWMERMGYTRAAVAPAIAALSGLSRFVTSLLTAFPDALQREVRFRGEPGGVVYSMTVEQMIGQEVEHARVHLQDVSEMRKQRSGVVSQGEPGA